MGLKSLVFETKPKNLKYSNNKSIIKEVTSLQVVIVFSEYIELIF